MVKGGRVELDRTRYVDGHLNVGGAGEIVGAGARAQHDIVRGAGGAVGADDIAGRAARLQLVLARGAVGAWATQER